MTAWPTLLLVGVLLYDMYVTLRQQATFETSPFLAGCNAQPLNSTTDQISCYSCMSKFYEANWPILQNIYNRPRNFTDDCDFHADRPDPQRNVGLVKCDSVCIKMYEQSQIGGLQINGFARGCYDNMVRRGFNETIVKWYRWLQRDSCHEYSKRQVLQLGPDAPDGVVTICTCYADGCNGNFNETQIEDYNFL